jgi:hypothetical protein
VTPVKSLKPVAPFRRDDTVGQVLLAKFFSQVSLAWFDGPGYVNGFVGLVSKTGQR